MRAMQGVAASGGTTLEGRAVELEGEAALFTGDAVVSLGTLDDVRGRDALHSAMTAFYARNLPVCNDREGFERRPVSDDGSLFPPLKHA